MLYNVRKKEFSDGTTQYVWHDKPQKVNYARLPRDPDQERGEPADKERSQKTSRSRAVQAVYDIAQFNNWDYFLTLTFNPELVNSFDYEECVKHIVLFTTQLRHRGVQYVLVPEQHESGAWHFHGLLADPEGRLILEPAFNPKTGKALFDKSRRRIYNLSIYTKGFSTVTKVGHQAKASGYICKYITKADGIPEGKKRYWASRGLNRAQVKYLTMPKELLPMYVRGADYSKICAYRYGVSTFLEYKGKGEHETTP